MRLVERARVVRDTLLEKHAGGWTMTLVEGIVAPTFALGDLSAVLWSEGHMEIRCSGPGQRPAHSVQRKPRFPPYTMDVWVGDRCVMSLSWTEHDEIVLCQLRRGDWEAEYFALPPCLSRPSAVH